MSCTHNQLANIGNCDDGPRNYWICVCGKILTAVPGSDQEYLARFARDTDEVRLSEEDWLRWMIYHGGKRHEATER